MINCIALAETEDVNILRRESLEDALNIFEEYACGGLEYLDEVIDRANCKESIQQQIQDLDGDHLTDDITNLFQQNIRSKTLTEINIISVRLSR